jgi:hypothetical protein
MTHRLFFRFAPLAFAACAALAAGVAVAHDYGNEGGATRSLGSDYKLVQYEDEGACLDNREIQQGINSGKILPLSEVLANEGISQRPLSVRVCEVGGRPHYVVNLIDSYGDSERVVLNAEAGY